MLKWFLNRRHLCAVLLLAMLSASAVGKEKRILLRNETILTPPKQARVSAQAQAHRPVRRGLFLIQLEDRLQPDWKTELKAQGVDLLRYVPEDAYVAQLDNAAPGTILDLPFVRWVGPLRPEYKIQSRLAHRARRPGPVEEEEAVSILLSPRARQAEAQSIRRLLSGKPRESRLHRGTILRAKVRPSSLQTLAESPAVLWVEPAPQMQLYDEITSKIVGGDDGQSSTPTLVQQLGYDGSGVTVAVADSGLDSGDIDNMHPDLAGRVDGLFYYGNLTDAADEHGHGTHVAGIIAGDAATGETDSNGFRYGLGVASGAHIVGQRIFDAAGGFEAPPTFETLTREAVRAGAVVGNNSWGDYTQGRYDLSAAEFDELVRDADFETPGDQPYILEFSAGNAGSGEQTIGSPAVAKNVIASGAAQSSRRNPLFDDLGDLGDLIDLGDLEFGGLFYDDGQEAMADFSSRGPCEDGRIKPDVVAPGTWITSLRSVFANDAFAWLPISDHYMYQGGTSQSGPHVSGAAAVFVQYYRINHGGQTPSPALVKAALINSAVDMDDVTGDTGPVPNNDEGWGRVDLSKIVLTNEITAPRYYEYVDQTHFLTNGQVYSRQIFVQSPDQPLKITLAYTDVPGFAGAIPALVNDLDLEVVAPDGTLYRGNQFGAGDSIPNSPTPDKINNVEAVHLRSPMPGDYLVRVRGSGIVADAISMTPDIIDQDFALVSSGNLVRPGTGFVLLDRPSYTAPSQIGIKVFDADLAANNTISLLVSNRTTGRALTSTLLAVGDHGMFTGAVETVAVAASPDQMLIGDGHQLEVVYVDSSGKQRTASAMADLVSPTIIAPDDGTDIGVMTITWQTDEPTASTVRYGTSQSNLDLIFTDSTLKTDHRVRLNRLAPDQTYFYQIESTDAAGNRAVDGNGGALYTFVGVATPTVLLVDAYDTTALQGSPSTLIPDSAYTNVLASAGISYEFWKVNERGSPRLDDLRPFPVVMWRTTDDAVNYGVDPDGLPDPSATNNTLTAEQQFMVQSYLNEGGSFFMASMNILSRIGNTPFRRQVLQVAQFKRNQSLLGLCPDCDEDSGVPAVYGAPDSIASGIDVSLDYSGYPWFSDLFDEPYGPDFSDTFTPASESTVIFFDSVSGKTCGVSYPRIGSDIPGRVVFLSFPLDAMPASSPSPNNAVDWLKNVVSFLAPGASGAGEVFFDRTVYTTNDLLIVEVGDHDRVGAGRLDVTLKSSSSAAALGLALTETTHRGLFRGKVTLVPDSPGAGQLKVAHGDTISASYFDESSGSEVTTSATIDAIHPTISDVAATTDYANARVTWQTSKPADSSVQYGLSRFLEFSTHSEGLEVDHQVTISGLFPERIYYYRVLSRDKAGNTTVDDNNGDLYTFTTLKAPTPPWFADLEADTNGWTVVPDSGSDVNWLLGTPNSSLATSAYSGTNAWGCSLNGEQSSFLASSFLVSPILDLTHFRSATLTFRTRYDFNRTDPFFGLPLEDGVVFVSTNTTAAISTSLPSAVDLAGHAAYDWQLETVDLTAFTGHAIQLVFYYQGIVIDSSMLGWLIDDISVTGVVAGGDVSITKNLQQGTWSLSSLSPIGLVPIEAGVTPSVTFTNLPAGDYVVQFSAVPYYGTPAQQTNTLTVDGSLMFVGDYAFLDLNDNGISDSWERDFLGGVSPDHVYQIDTDLDGASDGDEFFAGTNPTNAMDRLDFALTPQPNHLVRAEWPTVPGRAYRLEATTNFVDWMAVTDWTRARDSMLFQLLEQPEEPAFYRVQVRP